MLKIYSPINPIKISCTAPKKNIPIRIGAVPATKVSQKIIFNTRYTKAIMKLNNAMLKPINVDNLNPTFVYDVKLNIAASYSLKNYYLSYRHAFSAVHRGALFFYILIQLRFPVKMEWSHPVPSKHL